MYTVFSSKSVDLNLYVSFSSKSSPRVMQWRTNWGRRTRSSRLRYELVLNIKWSLQMSESYLICFLLKNCIYTLWTKNEFFSIFFEKTPVKFISTCIYFVYQKFYKYFISITIFTVPKVIDLNEQVQSKTDADDAIMVAVNNKVEEWKVSHCEGRLL